jgi:hypothetical protein
MKFRASIALFTGVASLALAMPAGAATTPSDQVAPVPALNVRVTYNYATDIRAETIGPNRMDGEINSGVGILHLMFNTDGSITGTYKPDNGNFELIRGARTGDDDLWISIHGRRFTGHFTSNGLVMISSPSIAGATLHLRGNFRQS